MKNSILVLGLIASASSLTAWESRPDFSYTGTNEDGEQEEVKTGKGRK